MLSLLKSSSSLSAFFFYEKVTKVLTYIIPKVPTSKNNVSLTILSVIITFNHNGRKKTFSAEIAEWDFTTFIMIFDIKS